MRELRRAAVTRGLSWPVVACRGLSWPSRKSRAALALLLALLLVAAGGENQEGEEDPVALERLLWRAASDGAQPRAHAARAAAALRRLWQDDAEALCHVTAVFAALGQVDDAASVCRRAEHVQPLEPCAIFCALHYALWTCSFDSYASLRERAVAAVAAAVAHRGGGDGDGMPAALGFIEATLVLPKRLLAQHLQQQTRHLLAVGGRRLPKLSVPLDASALQEQGTGLRVGVLTSTAREHAHGHALLAFLRGLRAGGSRAHRGVHVTCFDTSVGIEGSGDQVRVAIERRCCACIGSCVRGVSCDVTEVSHVSRDRCGQQSSGGAIRGWLPGGAAPLMSRWR